MRQDIIGDNAQALPAAAPLSRRRGRIRLRRRRHRRKGVCAPSLRGKIKQFGCEQYELNTLTVAYMLRDQIGKRETRRGAPPQRAALIVSAHIRGLRIGLCLPLVGSKLTNPVRSDRNLSEGWMASSPKIPSTLENLRRVKRLNTCLEDVQKIRQIAIPHGD